jgi:hypothetical protein
MREGFDGLALLVQETLKPRGRFQRHAVHQRAASKWPFNRSPTVALPCCAPRALHRRASDNAVRHPARARRCRPTQRRGNTKGRFSGGTLFRLLLLPSALEHLRDLLVLLRHVRERILFEKSVESFVGTASVPWQIC